MGNDQSKLKGIQIDSKAVEITDFWSLHNAEIPNEDGTSYLSIFREEPFIGGQIWGGQSPLERTIKNLMIYRHPCIPKYVGSWKQGSQRYLAIERSQPLTLGVQKQSDMEVCLGLKNILCGLIFLVEQAEARHLNICPASVFIGPDGQWKLGGFDYVWSKKDFNKNILNSKETYRYKNAIDSNEAKNGGENLEQFAFATLCEEILKNRTISNIPYIQEFKDYCAQHLKHQNVAMRPKLSAVLLHPYFNHEFVQIHSFLSELPLKPVQEKQDFFTGLIDRLRYFDENIVASQLGNLLLSRMVLLDPTAQLCVTPCVLKIKTDLSAALFSVNAFTKFIIPKIKQIFHVRDTQIRLILLEYFNEYVKLFNKEELEDEILPHMLLGIKDTNDVLVAKTMHCLADLIPILGSEVVIGNNRRKLFADGRPQGLLDSTTSRWIGPRSITPVMMNEEYVVGSASPLPDSVDVSDSFVTRVENILMPERLSPDGGEDVQLTTDGELEIEGGEQEEDAWSDWDNDNNTTNITSTLTTSNTQSSNLTSAFLLPENQPSTTALEIKQQQLLSKSIIPDIDELDIKNQKLKSVQSEEIDFFKDMEPVIQSTSRLVLTEQNGGQDNNTSEDNRKNQSDDVQLDSSRFDFKTDDEIYDDPKWGDEDYDWSV